MKKLILSKQCTHKHDNVDNRYKTQEVPKQFLVSKNWTIRNDSANIASVLQSTQCSPRKCLQDIAFHPGGTKLGAFRKRCLGTNSCYCQETKIKSPALLKRPNTCLSFKEAEDKFKHAMNTKMRSSFYCFCKDNYDTTDYADSSQRLNLKKYREELEDFNNSDQDLQITEQRKEYEKFRDNEYEKSLRDIEPSKTRTIMSKKIYKSPTESGEYPSSRYNSDDLNVFTQNLQRVDEMEDEEKYGHDHKKVPSHRSNIQKEIGTLNLKGGSDQDSAEMDKTNISTNANINELRTFRDKNYFETHDLNWYEMNDRNDPVSEDIRSSTLEKQSNDFSKTSYFSDGVTYQKLKNIAKCYQLGLVPNPVLSTNSSIEIGSNKNISHHCNRFIGRLEKPHYMNTFALRQQKMTSYQH